MTQPVPEPTTDNGGNVDDGVIINQDICDAILIHHLLGYRHESTGEKRVVEPHAYGVMHDGHHALLAWRVAENGTESNAPEGWELVHLFEGHRQGYRRGDSRMRLIHSQL
jgi:hypothetical protein